MTTIFTCTEDNVAPVDIIEAGENGILQVNSSIGWVDLSEDDFTGARNNCEYRINPINIFN